MLHRAFRTIGALAVLLVIGGMALYQLWPSAAEPIFQEIAQPDDTSGTSEAFPGTQPDEEPFTYHVGLLSGISTDNFWAFYGGKASVWNAYVLGPTKPALFALDPTTGAVLPELAETATEPTVENDTWSVNIQLRDDLYWSDGLPITAFDVVYTFETVRELGLAGSWETAYPASIVTMEATTPFELRIEFDGRPSIATWPHGVGLAPIMSAHVWEAITTGSTADALYAEPGLGDVGGGPLGIASISDGEIISQANPSHPLAGAVDTVVYKIYEGEDAAVAALGAGEVDTILSPHGLTSSNSELARTYPAVTVDVSPSNSIRYLGFNLTKTPMSEPAFRLAIAILLDRDNLATDITGSPTAAFTFVNPANERWFDSQAQQDIASRYRGQLADRLTSTLESLVDAGYSWSRAPSLGNKGEMKAGQGLRIHGDKPGPITILTPGDTYDPFRPDYATEVAKVLNWLGFDVVPIETDFDTVTDLAFTRDEDGNLQYDMYLSGWTLGNSALPDYYRHLFAADGALNNTGYDSEVFAKQLARYENAYTYEEAFAALWDMEATLAGDLPYLLLYTTQISEAYRSDRVQYAITSTLGGLQGRLGGIGDVIPVS